MPIETTLDNIDNSPSVRIRIRPRQLDRVFGKILVPNQISVLHGKERRPMTHLSHMIAVAYAKAGLRAYYVQSGKSYRPHLVRLMLKNESDIDSLLRLISLAPVMNIEDLEHFSSYLKRKDTAGIIILDSLTSLLNLSTKPGTKDRARKLFKILSILRDIVNTNDLHVLLTDHSNTDWQTGQYVPQGGNVLLHAVDTVMKIDRLEVDDESISISIERTSIVPSPSGVLVRLTETGATSLRSRGG